MRRPVLQGVVAAGAMAFGAGVLTLAQTSLNQNAASHPPPPPPPPPCIPVDTNVVCDPEPGPRFLSATATNQCAHPMIVASATYTNVPGTNITTITYSNCPPLVTTQQVSSVILSNWWTADGAAVPSSGPGLGAAFDVTNCGGGKVHFFITHSNPPPCPCTNATTISTSVDYAIADCTHHMKSGNSIPLIDGTNAIICPTNGSFIVAGPVTDLCGDSVMVQCNGRLEALFNQALAGYCSYTGPSQAQVTYMRCRCGLMIVRLDFAVEGIFPGSPFPRKKEQGWDCTAGGPFGPTCYFWLLGQWLQDTNGCLQGE